MAWLSDISDVAGVVQNVDDNQLNEEDLPKQGHAADDTAAEQLRARLCQDLPDSLHLANAFLKKCLVYQCNNVERAATTASGFVRFRTEARWPSRIPASDVERALKTGLHWLLRGKASKSLEGPAACLVFNMASLDPEVCSIEEYQKLSLFLMEHATDNLDVQTRGVALIVDFRGVQFSKLSSALRMEDLRRGLRCWVGSFPCRLRRIWLLAAPTPVRWITSAVSKFLSSKVRERIRFVEPKAMQDIQNDLGEWILLPASLGGADSFDWDAQVNGFLKDSQSLTRVSL